MSLQASGISVTLGGRRILDQVDAHVPLGKITAILGPNGAGKTTLLRVLSGDLRPGQGEVKLGSDRIDYLSTLELARRRAVLPQQSRPAFGFKSWELVKLGRSPFGETDQDAAHSVQKALARVDALHLAEREADTLSGGERQRIFLAKALCQAEGNGGDAGYLLLDEPTAALDMKQTASLMHILRDTAQSGIGIAMIAHDVRSMRHYADRCLLISAGRVETCENARSLSDNQVAKLYNMDIDDLAMSAA